MRAALLIRRYICVALLLRENIEFDLFVIQNHIDKTFASRYNLEHSRSITDG